MKILVSKTYLDWKAENKNDRAAKAFDTFLLRVFGAANSAEITPQPKAAGNNLRKMTGTVNEFTLSRKFRVYSRYIEAPNGEVCFYLATVGVKGVTDQHDDIMTALGIFDDVAAQKWEQWSPSPEQLESVLGADKTSVDNGGVGDADEKSSAKAVKPRKTGKPVDENGLTPAERKAILRQQQEEARKQAQAEKRARKAKQQTAAAADAAAAPADVQPAAVTVQEPVVQTVFETPSVDNVVTDNGPVSDNITDDEVRVLGQGTGPSVTVNGAPVEQPKPISVDLEFEDFADAEYRLEIIEHQMTIEKLQIEIKRHEIALEELAMKKLRLLQMQKEKGLQK